MSTFLMRRSHMGVSPIDSLEFMGNVKQRCAIVRGMLFATFRSMTNSLESMRGILMRCGVVPVRNKYVVIRETSHRWKPSGSALPTTA